MRERLGMFERLLERRRLPLRRVRRRGLRRLPVPKYAAGRDPADDELFHRILEENQPLGDDHPNLSGWIDRIVRTAARLLIRPGSTMRFRTHDVRNSGFGIQVSSALGAICGNR